MVIDAPHSCSRGLESRSPQPVEIPQNESLNRVGAVKKIAWFVAFCEGGIGKIARPARARDDERKRTRQRRGRDLTEGLCSRTVQERIGRGEGARKHLLFADKTRDGDVLDFL